MDNALPKFLNTVDTALRKLQKQVWLDSGVSKQSSGLFRYIDAINELNEPTITEISEQMDISKASVTIGIQKLMKLGYVKKVRSIQDKRVYHVSLADPGLRMIQAKQKAMKEYGVFIHTALGKEESRQFEATIIKIVKYLNDHPDGYPSDLNRDSFHR
jgi:DNA-binding MarR family transcriptional regulator